MGASQSTSENDQETVILNETPIQFSQDVVNHLADASASPELTPSRQSTLDEHIRSRIQNEIQRLREEEENVRNEIQTALEKEVLTLDGDAGRSRTNADDGEPSAPLNSIVLLGDVEEVKQKVDKYHSRAASESVESIKNAANSIVTCYKNNQATTLNCWREVANFKDVVERAEQQHLHSLQ